ncbi:hypothetical protein LOD99_8807 [Oopsacas minuta]|uniref:MATH domain-containing protein n=1 Tax=Oopsacas minuta TaxID=111878 RepID=A0AAV7JEN4_9METZ|nr:hypothetical protein LOD99_8807 [Oopsacas minuta]
MANYFSNYDGTNYTPVFEMANHWSKESQDEERRFLHRDNAWGFAKVFICSKHFNDDDVLLHFDILMGNGTVEKVSRKPGLKKSAKPVNLSNCTLNLQGSSKQPDRLYRNEIGIRDFRHALELSRAEHKKRSDSFFCF